MKRESEKVDHQFIFGCSPIAQVKSRVQRFERSVFNYIILVKCLSTDFNKTLL